MTNFKKQVFSVVTAGVMVANIATPAFASTIEISGNGAGSDNWTTVNQTSTNTVTQNNTANVTNTVNADAKTGGNDANFNTGGNVIVGTGNATVKADITNNLNTNAAQINCCETGGLNTKISGNGANSENGVAVTNAAANAIDQNNTANVTNTVNADAKTGGNNAGLNTGGDVIIGTGNAMVDTNISTTANVNSAKIGGALGGAAIPSASFVISGNGAGSDNYITATLTKVNSISQDNDAHIYNTVNANAKTGGNDAGFNTGGDVIIGTGDATVLADVDNSVNFNHADINCGCTWDVLAKITGNGADTDSWNDEWFDFNDGNLIDLDLTSVQAIGQGNGSHLNNNLKDLDAKTGYNDVSSNTAEVGENSDPAIYTGDALVDSNVSNSGNVNHVGSMPFHMPTMPNVNVSFNVAALLAFFGMSM